MDTINLATFNVRTPCDKAPNNWEARIPRILAIMDKYEFDIVGLQEATLKQLNAITADPKWAYCGNARENGDTDGEYSCILYRKDRFIVKATNTFWLSETPDMPGSRSWDTCCTRICTWATMQDKNTGKVFTHFNTHLDHRSKPAQINGIKLILKTIQEKFSADMPKILTGDFNVYPDSEVITACNAALNNVQKVARNGYHANSTFTYHGYGTWQNPNPGRPCQIDYIYVTPNVDVDTVNVYEDTFDGLYPSDHFPVKAILRFK